MKTIDFEIVDIGGKTHVVFAVDVSKRLPLRNVTTYRQGGEFNIFKFLGDLAAFCERVRFYI